MSTVQQKIAHTAARHVRVTTLAQHLTVEWLEEAHQRTNKRGAPGIDGQTEQDFADQTAEDLSELVNSCKSGRYRAPAVRRVHIPKNSSETRALGIPTFTDRVVQRSVVMLLEPIFEQTFYDCSYGFRPKRSAHDCIKALWGTLSEMRGCYVLDVDIRKYFDSIPKARVREFVATRVGDGVITRLIDKWLKAGVMEKGELSYHELGTPQGGVISPLLSNIYLHYVLDEWFHETVLKELRGQARLFRFADDFVVAVKQHEDAVRLERALSRRFSKYGLAIHDGKSRMLDFRPGCQGDRSFEFLGFLFYWGRSRRGRSCIKVRTAKARMSRTLRNLSQLCRKIRHEPIRVQRARLNRSLVGHYNYYGVSFNSGRLWQLRRLVTRIWFKWLRRRSQRRHLIWDRFLRILRAQPLAVPRIAVPLW